MAVQRFILAADTDVQTGTGRVHYSQGTPVVLDPEDMAFAGLADSLRPEDPARDQAAQAAVVLRGLPVPCGCRHVPALTPEGFR